MDALTNREAWQLYDALETHSNVTLVSEPNDIDLLWRDFSSLSSSSPKVWMDSYLAAFAIAHNATLVSFDSDFTQYPQLKFILLK